MKHIIFLLIASLSIAATAQTANQRKNTRQGNKAYRHESYEDAETAYRKALDTDSTYFKALYNLGNTQYRQQRYDDAARTFSKALQSPDLTVSKQEKAHYNRGNSHLQAGMQDRANGMQHFQQAVEDYKQALLLNPKNDEARYNLSYAQKLLAQAQQQQQNNGGQQNQDQQQQNQNQQQQNQDKNQQQQGQQQNQDQQNQQQDQQQQNQQQDKQQQDKQEPKQSQGQKEKAKQDAERLLEAVRNNEKNTLKEQQRTAVPVKGGRIEKDW